MDLSQYWMDEFHYDVMLKKDGKTLRLCYQDTDSRIYEIETEEDMRIMKEWFDFSDYSKDYPLYDEK